MTYVAEKLVHLIAEIAKLRALAEEITNKPVLTASDRKCFEEYLELIAEIRDYAQRLQRPGEQWRNTARR